MSYPAGFLHGPASAQRLPTQTAGVVGAVIFSGDNFFDRT